MLLSTYYKKYVFAAVILGLIAYSILGVSRTQANTSFDRSFILNRAVELAQFAPNEKTVLPEIKYFLPGDNRAEGSTLNSQTLRVVTILDPSYGLGGVQAVFRAPTYRIIDGSKQSSIKSFKRVVGDVLKENGFEIANEDVVEPALSTTADIKKEIKITRVSLAEIQDFETLPYRTRKIDDDTLDKGKTKVSQAGKNGQKTLTYQVRREDGNEVSRTLVSEQITTQPVDEIIKIGTKPAITVRCRYNDTVLAAAVKYKQDPNALCNLMMKESNGNASSIGEGSDGTRYLGLFQYDEGFWPSASSKAGYSGASWQDATAQIYTTAYLFSIGQGGRW